MCFCAAVFAVITHLLQNDTFCLFASLPDAPADVAGMNSVRHRQG